MVKRSVIFLICFCWILIGCSKAEETIPPTPLSATSTDTPSPTDTPLPTNTPEPTYTPTPAWEPIDIAELEAALGAEGYRRTPFKTGSGLNGFTWYKENTIETLRTYENGVIKLQVLHDKSPSVRSEHMASKLMVLDQVSPAGFMARLREVHSAYNDSVSAALTGEPEQVSAYGDSWNTREAEYYVVETDIGDYYARFSVWWTQATCPPGYQCSLQSFPGLEFTGDSSLVIYTILLIPNE